MDTALQTLDELFSKDVHYAIPSYQRRYVWQEEDQWEPLWADVKKAAETYLQYQSKALRAHFLGAIVLQQKENKLTEPLQYEVIDGQQRLTTLQLLLSAVKNTLMELRQDKAGYLKSLIYNQPLFAEQQLLKITSTRHDQAAFRIVMTHPEEAENSNSRLAQAYRYFSGQVSEWLSGIDESQLAERSDSLLTVLKSKLQFVVIETESDDDANLIFETLNARGTPLLAWDLARNYIANHTRSGMATNLNLDEFSSDWWQEETGRGKERRTRIDSLLIAWMTMRVVKRNDPQTELPASAVDTRTARAVFDAFQRYVRVHEGAVERVAADLIQVSEHYRKMLELSDNSPLGVFLQRWRTLPSGGFNSVVLWLLAELDGTEAEEEQRQQACAVIESYVVRRLLTGKSRGGGGQDTLRLVTDLLNLLPLSGKERVGDKVANYFDRLRDSNQRMACPSDQDLRGALEKDFPLYGAEGKLNRRQTVMVLRAIEAHLRDDVLDLPINFTIEHLLPQKWAPTHYPHPDANVDLDSDPEARAEREILVSTIGNLTLVTRKLNARLSNGPFSEKKAKLNQYDVLLMNNHLQSMQKWDEGDIRRRSRQMAEYCAEIWPAPDKLSDGTLVE